MESTGKPKLTEFRLERNGVGRMTRKSEAKMTVVTIWDISRNFENEKNEEYDAWI